MSKFPFIQCSSTMEFGYVGGLGYLFILNLNYPFFQGFFKTAFPNLGNYPTQFLKSKGWIHPLNSNLSPMPLKCIIEEELQKIISNKYFPIRSTTQTFSNGNNSTFSDHFMNKLGLSTCQNYIYLFLVSNYFLSSDYIK